MSPVLLPLHKLQSACLQAPLKMRGSPWQTWPMAMSMSSTMMDFNLRIVVSLTSFTMGVVRWPGIRTLIRLWTFLLLISTPYNTKDKSSGKQKICAPKSTLGKVKYESPVFLIFLKFSNDLNCEFWWSLSVIWNMFQNIRPKISLCEYNLSQFLLIRS